MLASAACAGSERRSPEPATDGGADVTLQPGSTPPPGLVPPDVLDEILDDAAAASGTDRDALQIVSASSVRWPDGSLGCPEPGRFYTQTIVEGWQMIIRAAGRELDYRGGGSTWRRCERPGVGFPSDPGTY